MAAAVAHATRPVTATGVAAAGAAALMMRMVFAVRRRRRVYEEHAAAFVSGNAHQDDDTVGDIRRANLRIRREAERQPKMMGLPSF